MRSLTSRALNVKNMAWYVIINLLLNAHSETVKGSINDPTTAKKATVISQSKVTNWFCSVLKHCETFCSRDQLMKEIEKTVNNSINCKLTQWLYSKVKYWGLALSMSDSISYFSWYIKLSYQTSTHNVFADYIYSGTTALGLRYMIHII